MSTPLLTGGTQVRFLPPELDTRKGKPIGDGTRFAHELPRSEFAVLARTGHDAPEESPDQVNRLVLAYLKEGLSRIPENVAWSSPSSQRLRSSSR